MNREGLSPHARHVLLGDRRCIGTNRDGQRCKNSPMVGQFVCAFHGGKSPLALQAADAFLAGLREPAYEVLFRAMRNAPPCTHCGRSDADRDPTAVRAALGVLDRVDRAGGRATYGTAPRDATVDYRAWIPQERMEVITSWLAEARAACERGDPLPDTDKYADAVLVEGHVESGDHLD